MYKVLRSHWILGATGVALVAVTVGLLPGECLTRLKVPAVPAGGEFLNDPVTTCESLAGVEWPGRRMGQMGVVAIDLLLVATGLTLHVRRKRKQATPAE